MRSVGGGSGSSSMAIVAPPKRWREDRCDGPPRWIRRGAGGGRSPTTRTRGHATSMTAGVFGAVTPMAGGRGQRDAQGGHVERPRRAGGHGRSREDYLAGRLAVAGSASTLSFRTDLAGIGAASAKRPTIRRDTPYRFHASLVSRENWALKSRLITSHSRVLS